MTALPESVRKMLPTMYDLPSEFVGEPGLPDEFHTIQPQLLMRSLELTDYPRDRWFAAMDLHVYYDLNHPLWYERPDWFLAVGVPRCYRGREWRKSYVTWQEEENPMLVVEFLSPSTEAEDLGQFYRADAGSANGESNSNSNGESVETPPGKLLVYEQWLQIPHYVVYRQPDRLLRYFRLENGRYQEQTLSDRNPRIWFSDLKVGLGIWQGRFEGVQDAWLRWCDRQGNWLPTDTEREQQQREQAEAERDRERWSRAQAEAERDRQRQLAEQERQQRAQAEAREARLRARLKELGIDPDET